MLIGIDLTPVQFRAVEEEEEEEDGRGIWPSRENLLRPCLWQRLPFDVLFDCVLVHLPFPTILKLRCVSRTWRSQLSSHSFWTLWFNCVNKSNDVYGSKGPKPGLNNILKNPNGPNLNNILKNPNGPNLNLNFYPNNLVQNPNPNPSHTENNRNGMYPRNLSSHQEVPILSEAYTSNRPRPRIVPSRLLCSVQPRKFLNVRAANWMKQKSIRYRRSQLPLQAQKKPHEWVVLHGSFLPIPEPYTILSCNMGLLLVAQNRENAHELIVCNPLLRLQKVLPNPTFPLLRDIFASGFITELEHQKYTVILSGAGCEIFDSSVCKWQLAPPKHFKSISPPLLKGSTFWLSQQMPSFHNKIVLSAYSATEKVVMCVNTQFPAVVCLPRCGHVWKDSQGLKTLALKDNWLGIWKLDVGDGMWKQDKTVLWAEVSWWDCNGSDLHYVKVGNLLFVSYRHLNKVYVFNLELNKGCWTALFSNSESGPTGLCVYEPSCIRV